MTARELVAGRVVGLAVGPTVNTDADEAQSIYYAKNILGSSANTITVAFSDAAAFPAVRVLEYGGLDPTSPLDTTAEGNGSDGPDSTGPLTTSVANDQVIVANLVGGCVDGPTTGYTTRDSSGCNLVEDMVAATPGSYSASVPADGFWIQQMVAFKPAGAVVPPQAPANDTTVASTIAATTSFLYTGSNPVQTGVTAGAIAPARAAVLHGRVLDRNSQPIANVTASIVGHPEFGSTRTSTDGTFSMAVNGGGSLVVNYSAGGFLPVQRTVPTTWNDYAVLPDVVLTPLDVATVVDFQSPASYQVAAGTPVTDSDGTRTATLVIPPGTTATLNGAAVSSLTIHATEYTVGATGPQAMPGTLPPNSGYHY